MRTIHQIEVTSRCNLACVYCAHSKMSRPKVDITDALFERALKWIDFFVARGTQDRSEINLSGVGETLLHPKIADYVAEIRDRYGESICIFVPTNGLMLTEDLAARLAPHRPELHFSTHVPAKVAAPIALAKRYGLFGSAALSPAVTPMNWAGQVDWISDGRRFPCRFLVAREGFISSTGAILTCCLDITGESQVGHVMDEPTEIPTRRWKLCDTCNQGDEP